MSLVCDFFFFLLQENKILVNEGLCVLVLAEHLWKRYGAVQWVWGQGSADKAVAALGVKYLLYKTLFWQRLGLKPDSALRACADESKHEIFVFSWAI